MGTSVLRRIQIQGIWITGAPLYRWSQPYYSS
jgi:hypothetical protein